MEISWAYAENSTFFGKFFIL